MYFVPDRLNALAYIRSYCAFLLTQKGKHIKIFCIDNAYEYISQDVRQYLRTHGIRLELTAPYSSSQNGIAERLNRTLMEAARAMLFARDMPLFLWPEAVSYANYIKNRAPTCALWHPPQTPFEAFWGRKPNVAHLREFGADIWVLREDPGLHKMEHKSRAAKFVGFLEESRAYYYYNPAT